MPPTSLWRKEDLHIDNWGVKKCNETKTGFANLVDEHLGDHKLKDV